MRVITSVTTLNDTSKQKPSHWRSQNVLLGVLVSRLPMLTDVLLVLQLKLLLRIILPLSYFTLA